MARGGKQTTLTLRLIDGVSKPGRAVQAALGGVNRAISGMKSGAFGPLRMGAQSAERLATNVSQVQVAGVAASAGVWALSRQILSSERALNKAMAAGNLSLDQRAALYGNAIDLNYKYGGSVDDVINANTELLRSGLDYGNANKALPDVMNLAQATGEDTVSVARAIVTNLTALRLGMDQTARSADLFVQALDRTAGVDLIDFETSGKYFNPVAAATGMSAEEAMAFQIEMALRGLFGSSSGTGLRAAPASILAPTKKARASFEGLGINPDQFRGKRTAAAGNDQVLGALSASGIDTESIEPQIAEIMNSKLAESEKIKAIVSQLGEELGIVTAEDRSEITQTLSRAFASGVSEVDLFGFLQELKNKGAGFADYEAIFGRYHASKFLGFDMEAYLRELGLLRTDARGSTDRKAGIMMQGLPGDVNNAEGALQGFIAALSNSGVLSDFSNAAAAFAQTLERISEQNPTLLRLAFGATVALAALAPLGLIATGTAAALGILFSPVTLVAGALAGLVALNWRPLANGMRTFGNHFARALDPSIVRRAKEVFSSRTGLFSRFQLGNLSLNRFAAEFGTGLGKVVNGLASSGPRVRAAVGGVVSSLAELGRAKFDEFVPKIEEGTRALRGMFDAFVDSKIDGILRLGPALMTFGQNVMDGLGPSVTSAIDLVAASFNTMTSGGEAVGAILEGALTGFTSFASGLLNAISPEAMSSVGSGLSSLFDLVSRPVDLLGQGFREVTAAVSGSTESIGSFANAAGTKVGEAINWIVQDLSKGKQTIINAWEGVKALFTSMGSYVPDFGPLVSAISNVAGRIAGALGRIGEAVTRARNAIGGLGSSGSSLGAAVGAAGARASQVQGPNLPRRAGGGAVRRGPYLVGEQGPEVVHMGGNGYVTPNHRLPAGGGGPININIYGATDPIRTGREVERRLERFASRTQQIGINR